MGTRRDRWKREGGKQEGGGGMPEASRGTRHLSRTMAFSSGIFSTMRSASITDVTVATANCARERRCQQTWGGEAMWRRESAAPACCLH